MKIYIGHSSDFDYVGELYTPIRQSSLNNEHDFILPHEKSDTPYSSKEFFENNCDIFIAEVSYPSTGLGIELGWADYCSTNTICIYKQGAKVTGALNAIDTELVEYIDSDDMINKIGEIIKKYE